MRSSGEWAGEWGEEDCLHQLLHKMLLSHFPEDFNQMHKCQRLFQLPRQPDTPTPLPAHTPPPHHPSPPTSTTPGGVGVGEGETVMCDEHAVVVEQHA